MAGTKGTLNPAGDAEACHVTNGGVGSEPAAPHKPRGGGWIPGTSKPSSSSNANSRSTNLCGPMYSLPILFLLIALVALVFFIIELVRKDGGDALRIINVSGFLLLSVCLVWFGNSSYLLKKRNQELVSFQESNAALQKQVADLTKESSHYKHRHVELEKLSAQLKQQNQSYVDRNLEHERLNNEMTELNAEMRIRLQDLSSQSEVCKQQNAEYKLQIDELTQKISDLGHIEKQLDLLANECNGSVIQARSLLERLERDLRLNTVNTVFLFFDRIDKKKNGKLDNEEVSLFVDNLSFLWRHLPTFDKDKMKAKLLAQGGISLEQVHEVVDGMMLEDNMHNPDALTKKLQQSFTTSDLNALLAEDAVEGKNK